MNHKHYNAGNMGKAKKDVGVIVRKDGVSFRVWAPFAKGVGLVALSNNWAVTQMQSEGDGYWSVTLAGARPGQEYKFLIDTGYCQIYRNDPRALHLTTSKGNSVIVDEKFDWSDQDFVMSPQNEQVVYEVHVGTFNRPDPSVVGTFDDVIAKLDYLASLGVTTIELMPIGSMENDEGWGYKPDYIYAIESLYGSRHSFKQLVNEAHERDIAVILDVVYNHIGPGDNDLWQFDGWSQDNKGGIYFYNDWRSPTPWGDTRLDYGRAEVRQYVLDNVKMWLNDCHVDGLRLDSTGFMRNVYGHNDDPGNDIAEGWWLMQEINNRARRIKPSSIMIAEDLGCNEYLTKPAADGGAGFSAQWETGFPFAMRGVFDTPDDCYRNLGNLSAMLEHRYNGDAFQRIIYSDSHDSAANGGARLSEEISPGDPGSLYSRRRSLLAAAMVLTVPGVPMLLQGQEFLEGGSFNDWQGLDWERAEKLDGMVLAHKHLVALRKNQYGNSRGLTGQSFAILHLNEETKILAYHRWDQGGACDDVVVIFNLANRMQKDYFINFPRPGIWQVRFNSDWKGYSPHFKNTHTTEVVVENGGGSFTIAPYAVLILSQD
jgi:1,4-alpha-glucan branching enzyme